MLRRRRTVRTLVLGGISTAIVGCGALVGLGTAAAPGDEPDLTPLLPLGQTNVNDRWVDTVAIPGRTLFRFDTVIKNIGYGAFEVYRSGSGTTYQRIWSGGDPRGTGNAKSFPSGAPASEDVPLPSGAPGQSNALRYSPAYGHEHFHSQRIAAYTLLGSDGTPVKEASKNLAGFCLYDSWGPPQSGAPQRYPSSVGDQQACAAKEPGYTGLLRMGISEDWGDFYRSQLWDQWVDVTDVTPGQYRLRATVNPDGLYTESNEANNSVEDPSVTIPGVLTTPRSVSTAKGAPVSIGLAGSVVGPAVKTRRRDCTDDQTRLASCMVTADPSAVTFAVAAPPVGQGTTSVSGATAIYTPPAGFQGTVVLTYTASDSRGLTSAPATITVRVGSGTAAAPGPGAASGGATAGGAGRFTLSARQLLINQRIGQAAIRRLNAVEARLDGRPAPAVARRAKPGRVQLSARQMRINQRVYQAAIRRAAALEARIEGRPAPAAVAGGAKDRIALSLRQLVINQHIAQAAVRRANALDARVP